MSRDWGREGKERFPFPFYTPLPKPSSAPLLQFFSARLSRATSRLSRKGLLTVYIKLYKAFFYGGGRVLPIVDNMSRLHPKRADLFQSGGNI